MTKVQNAERIFAQHDEQFEAHGYVCIPIAQGTKRPIDKNWQKTGSLSAQERLKQRQRHPDASIGIIAGTPLSTGRRFGFVDLDHPNLVRFVCEVLPPVSAKFGAKGLTIFCQVQEGLSSVKLKDRGATAPAVEIFTTSGMTVIPPSWHPTGKRYEWKEKSLLEVTHDELPILDALRHELLRLVVPNRHAWEIVEGGADVKGHQAMLSLTSSGIANLTDDLQWLARCLNALFHPDYQGDTQAETLGMLQSAKEKGLGRAARQYDPGDEGPIPLGYTRDGNYALRDQVRNIIIPASANQLLSFQYLIGLAPSRFWGRRFPSDKKQFDFLAAGETLISTCKSKGPFNALNVRGRGIWREGEEIIINLGGPIPSSAHNLYLCFDPIAFERVESFDTQRLLALLRRFNWRNSQDAVLLLGWLALAPVCGILNWRPHCFVYGPPRCGKTTIHTLAARLLHPLVISTDGQSSEAGIRQKLGPDSLPIIIDEFESDHQGAGLRGVLRLARSASSAENAVLRGTPEGKAMQFSLRTTFFFCAVNPGRMTPADQSRIMLLELMAHNNEETAARTIAEEERHFRDLGSDWCGYMLSIAELLLPSIDSFEAAILSTDRRHRQNFAALLGAAFIALNRRAPTEEEATKWAQEYAPAIEQHAENIERDNSAECLDHLLSHVVDNFPLSHWIATAMLGLPDDDQRYYESARVLETYGIVVRRQPNNDEGVLIRNGSPAVEKVFRDTPWAGRGWERALRALDGAFSVKNPVYFSGVRQKSRCVGIPFHYIPDPVETRGGGGFDFGMPV